MGTAYALRVVPAYSLSTICDRWANFDQTGFFHLGQELTECLLDLGQISLDYDLDAQFLQGWKQRFPFRVSSKMNAAGPEMSPDQRAFHGVGQERGKVVHGG